MFMATHSPDTITDYHADDASAHADQYGNTQMGTWTCQAKNCQTEFKNARSKELNMPARRRVLDLEYQKTSYAMNATGVSLMERALH
jgi:hypothetical protein